jgi:predicted negative regulator of RcsB-dependent stress response
MDEEKTPQEQIKEAIWTYTGWGVIVLVCIGAGVFIGFTLWGDAPRLRQEVTRLERRMGDLRNERESLQTQMAMTTRDRDECRQQLERLQEAPPPAPPDIPEAPEDELEVD